jgi:LVIVD repeat
MGEAATCLDIRDQYAYVGFYNLGIAIIDISDLIHPALSGIIDLDVLPKDIVATDELLMMCLGNNGLIIYDRTNPTAPTQLSIFENNSWIMDAEIRGDTAYLAEGGKGLTLLDIANPQHPVLLTSFAYLSTTAQGIYILDISNPNVIHDVASYIAGSTVVDLDVDSDKIYIADENDGVFILSFDSTIVSTSEPVSMKNRKAPIITRASPNPFKDKVEMEYYVNDPTDLKLAVYDSYGKLIHVVASGYHPTGVYSATWNVGKLTLPPGPYLLQIYTEKSVQTVGLIHIP